MGEPCWLGEGMVIGFLIGSSNNYTLPGLMGIYDVEMGNLCAGV